MGTVHKFKPLFSKNIKISDIQAGLLKNNESTQIIILS